MSSSEHIQPGPPGPPPPAGGPPAAHAPAVEHPEDLNFRLIIRVGIGLTVVAFVIQLVVWWMFRESLGTRAEQDRTVSPLALADADRPLQTRFLDVPAPHLEGFEPDSSLLILRVEDMQQTLYVAPNARVLREDKKDGKRSRIRLFDLMEGQTVTVAYVPPGGGAVGELGTVLAVYQPPLTEGEKPDHALPEDARRLTAPIVKIEPHGVAASREWAEAQMDRYGWADKKKDVARIPVAVAMDEVIKQWQAAHKGAAEKDRRAGPPSRANSGRGATKEKP